MSTILPIITLTIYILLIPPLLFCLVSHRLPGSLLSWGLLALFALIRIATSILSIFPGQYVNDHAIALLLSNVGLSPLLVGTAGVLHEARCARAPDLPKRLEYLKMGTYHAAVMVSILLLIIGFAQQPEGPANGFMKIGIAGVLICGCILASWIFASYDLSVEEGWAEAPGHGEGTKLLHATLTTLPIIALRCIYALLAVFLPPSKFKSSVAAKVIMCTVPEMVILTLFVVVGVWTRKIASRNTGRRQGLVRQRMEEIYPQTDDVDRWGFKN